MLFMAKVDSQKATSDSNRKMDNRCPPLICLNYGIKGHNLHRCYKLQSYPLGYKFQSSNCSAGGESLNSLALKSTSIPIAATITSSTPNIFSSLNVSQYSQLMDMHFSHLHAAKLNPSLLLRLLLM